jgi:hypothetical protein
MCVGFPMRSMVSAALCTYERLANPRVTISGTPHSSVTWYSTPASASFSSQTSTYSSSSRQ